MPKKRKSSKPLQCGKCSGTELVRRITTYPVMLTGELEGREIHVGRVALYKCEACGHLMPTPIGQVKIDRLVEKGTQLFLGKLE